MSRAGTSGSRSGRRFASTSWCRSPDDSEQGVPTSRSSASGRWCAARAPTKLKTSRPGRAHAYRPFGRTGLEVSELVFGGGWVGGILIHQDDATKRAAIAARARGRHQLDRHGTLLRRRPFRAGARLAAPGRGEEPLSLDQGAPRPRPPRRPCGQIEGSLEQSLERLRCDRSSCSSCTTRSARRPRASGSGSTRCSARTACRRLRAPARAGPDSAHRHHCARRDRGGSGCRERPVRFGPGLLQHPESERRPGHAAGWQGQDFRG